MAWEGDLTVGGFAFTKNNALVMCSNHGLFKLTRPARKLERLLDVPMAPDGRFNGITTDPRGRIFAGTLTERRVEGLLYCLERGKDPEVVLRDTGISNGMTFSLDLKHFYHTDSHIQTIARYDYDLASGSIEIARVIYQGRKQDGSPDGITMEAEGFIRVACYRGSEILRIDGEGRIIRELPIPATQPSSAMFGGENLVQLFITSASQGAVDRDRGLDSLGQCVGGTLLCVLPGATGRKEWRADWGAQVHPRSAFRKRCRSTLR